jgi:hypothetical protein
VLYSEQRRADFVPREDALSFDRPTAACLMGTGMLAALGAAARDTLEGPNLAALLAEARRAGGPGRGRRGFDDGNAAGRAGKAPPASEGVVLGPA